MARTQSRSALSLLAVCTVLTLAGCGDSRDNAQRLGDALASIERSDFQAAEVDLKNILKTEPDNIEARLALGHAAYGQGDYATAEQAWQRAREMGADGDDYALPLARALAERSAFAELLSELQPELISDQDKADELRGYRAQATLALGSRDEALALLEALDKPSTGARARHLALLGKAEIARAENDPGGAEQLVRESLSLVPDSTAAQLFLGQLLSQRGDYEQANKAYAYGLDELVPSRTERMMMMAGQVEALLALDRLDQASAVAQRLGNVGVEHPMIGYLQGRVAMEQGDMDRALQVLQESVSRSPDFTPASKLLGLAYLNRGEPERAEMLFASVLGIDPRDASARRLLARAQYMLNRPQDAQDGLRRGLTMTPDDSEMINMLARLSVRDGDPARAVELLEGAYANAPDDLNTALSLAAAYVAADRRDDAVALIDRALPETNTTDVVRKKAMLLLVRHEYDAPEKSLPAIRELRASAPDNAEMLSMTAALFDVAGATDEARADLARLVELRPDDPGPLLRLAALDERGGSFADSKARLLGYLQAHPGDENTLLALSRISEQQGDYAGSQDYLDRAHAANPTALRPNLALASRAMIENRLDEARGFASAAVDQHPRSGQAHALLGTIDIRRGDFQPALVSLAQATTIDPTRADWRMLRARAELAGGREEEARKSMQTAVSGAPDYLPAVRELALLEVRLGNLPAADALVDSLADHPERAALLAMTGDVRAAQGRPQQAAQAYADSFTLEPGRAIASKYYRVSRAAGEANPDALLRRWLQREPRDADARTFLAAQLQNRGDRAAAIREYELALESQPGNLNALNNLAWLLYESSNGEQAERALALARQAHEQSTGRPDIADTYGWLLTLSGRVEEGIEVLERTLGDAQPGAMPDVAYHLAASLQRRGDRDAARNMLQRTLNQADDFYSRDEAQALLDSL